MSYLTAQLEQERAALLAAGHTGAVEHRSMNESAFPVIRMYPVAPAQGTLSSAASAVLQAAVPGAGQFSSRPSRALSVATIAQLSGMSAASVSPDDVLIASSTAVMLETFLLQMRVTVGTVVLVPGLLLPPYHTLLDVLQSFGVKLVAFDVDVDTMVADLSGMRAALSPPPAAATTAAARPVMLLVGIKGRFFQNASDLYKLANEVGCSVVSFHAPTMAAGRAPAQAASNGSASVRAPSTTPVTAASLYVTSFDGPGSLGGALAYSPQQPVTAAMKRALTALPSAGPLQTWQRLARHICNVLLSNRLDYGSTVWLLAVLSRAGRGLSELLLQGTGLKEKEKKSKPNSGGGTGAPTAMDAARQEAMDWLYSFLANHEEAYPVTADHTRKAAGMGAAVIASATSFLRQAASVGSLLLPTAKDAPDRAKREGKEEKGEAGKKQPASQLFSLISPPSSLPPPTGRAARTSTRMSDVRLDWLHKLVVNQHQQRDAELLCFWYFLYSLPSYANVVSAGEAHTPMACVEAGLTSVVLRAQCPALVTRRLQQEGFAALPSRPVPYSDELRRKGVAAAVSHVSGVLYFPACKKCAAAAAQLCFIPLSPVMTPADHQLLVDLLSEMPRQWMSPTAQPVSAVTTGSYRRTDGRNFSNADRPYNTSEVRALLMEVSRRHLSGSRSDTQGQDGDLDRTVKAAASKLFAGRHPVLTYLMYGTQAVRLLVAKL